MADPLRPPFLQTGTKRGAFAPFGGISLRIPDPHLPVVAGGRGQLLAAIFNVDRLAGFHAARVPLAFHDYLVGRLHLIGPAGVENPTESRLGNIDPLRVEKILAAQMRNRRGCRICLCSDHPKQDRN